MARRLIAILCLWVMGGLAAEAATNAPAVIELRDQYDAPQRLAFPRTNLTVLTIADKKSAPQTDGWLGVLTNRYWGRVEFRGLADTSGVSGLLRGVARYKIRSTRKYPVMLDWEGTVCEALGFQAGQANVLVLDRNGGILARFLGPMTTTNQAAIITVLDRELAPATNTSEIVTNSLGMALVKIPAGEFVMGSPVTEPERATNEVQHAVKITKPFWLGQTHVTVAQFAAFVKDTGYQTTADKEGWANGIWNSKENKWNRLDGASWKNPGFEQGTNHPVVSVDWGDAVAFCQWLSTKEGRTYRLPTESEWEYACRAGTTTAYPWGDNPDDSPGWLNGADDISKEMFNLFTPFKGLDGYFYSSPVASFRPNAWGLYDMLGNALQWCSDWFGDYPAGPVADPQGLPEGKEHILRGGSFIYGRKHCRSAFRGRNKPEFRNYYVGFRVAAE